MFPSRFPVTGMSGWAHGSLLAHGGDSAFKLPRRRQRTWWEQLPGLCRDTAAAQPFFFFLISSSLMNLYVPVGILKGLDPLGSPRKPDPRSPKADPRPSKVIPLHPST